jgi:hypothetical protein
LESNIVKFVVSEELFTTNVPNFRINLFWEACGGSVRGIFNFVWIDPLTTAKKNIYNMVTLTVGKDLRKELKTTIYPPKNKDRIRIWMFYDT